MSHILDRIPDVDIDDHGTFKYILIKVLHEREDIYKHIVRGHARHEKHFDIYCEVGLRVDRIPDLRTSCQGGGRMVHDPDKKTITVYGFSIDLGRADHQLTISILKKKYPDYTITEDRLLYY